ncbi:benzoate/toluate 1,2-dioxygenase reductase subunit [Mesorhizobium sp. J18]|uniref:FAD-binding oxidoreductase n=1 Tax=Mesorhizobium sp. J18 TaxID=935263 RepID=UPI00119C2213|nr:FAD-binding oxidoreductase [Mesorhizobium sp. J18]TWG95955.1 benzoate/toluate 1,2-dioxygenase reductase subunit [Mesorhizobium sp. J18]
MPQQYIRIIFSDGEVMHFAPLDGESILSSAEKAGALLANDCRKGTCHTCVARNESGEEVPLCITPASPGLSLQLPYRRTEVTPPTLRRARINSFSRVSRSVWEIRYRLQFPLPFLPGQYVELSFPGVDGSRRFSMANPPSADEQVLHVRDLPGGGMSTYLNDRAKPEDAFTVRGPFGIFYLRLTPKPKLFVAGGTGLAPIVSMLSSIDPANGCPPLAMVVGFSHSADAYALQVLRRLAARLPLELILAADRADAGWPGIEANAVEALREVTSVPLAPGTEAYLCGPPGMVGAARAQLFAQGFEAVDVLNEEFIHGT